MSLFERQDWSFSAYGCESLVEELPSNMPLSFGPSMTMRVFVDSDHAGDLVTLELALLCFSMVRLFIGARRSKLLANQALLEVNSLL
jgi:hypothetical protein